MRWGKDNEERAAVSQKAHDAYAAARRAASVADGVASDVAQLRAEIADLRAELSALRRSLVSAEVKRPAPIRKAA